MQVEAVYPVRTHRHAGHAMSVRPRARAGAAALLGVVSLLAGCGVGPKYVRPETPLNAAWSPQAGLPAVTQAPPDSSWWQAFKDPGLDSLIERAVHQNLPLQVAGVRIMEARAQLGIATGRQYPQVQAIVGSANAVGVTQQVADFSLAGRRRSGVLDRTVALDGLTPGSYVLSVEARPVKGKAVRRDVPFEIK